MSDNHTAFAGSHQLASGTLAAIAPAVKAAYDAGEARLLIFNDGTGRQTDLDLRGDIDDVLDRLATPSEPTPKAAARGRPRLGVIAREVTLLPSHWEWLASQRGGASAALRRLVDQARRSGAGVDHDAMEAAQRVMTALAGDLSGFEEADRAFYAKDKALFWELSEPWPADVRSYVRLLAGRALG
ncbi:DUF2239 family protein [Phenylobacterium sp.]|uniref:DUF2239 family protein n=1 Tax=Phenylobacterium sp. TaxID=1871053 RepID=UPI0028966617|nr:DUF2239 family protein [Phenylobacterium sp.]